MNGRGAGEGPSGEPTRRRLPPAAAHPLLRRAAPTTCTTTTPTPSSHGGPGTPPPPPRQVPLGLCTCRPRRLYSPRLPRLMYASPTDQEQRPSPPAPVSVPPPPSPSTQNPADDLFTELARRAALPLLSSFVPLSLYPLFSLVVPSPIDKAPRPAVDVVARSGRSHSLGCLARSLRRSSAPCQ